MLPKQLTATDADVSTANLTMEVKEIAFGSGNLNDWEVLSSSPTNAQLRLKRAIDLDKGDTNTFLLKLTVRDGGSPELTGTASLILYILPDNEFQPEIISSPDNLTIPENVTIGTAVGTLIARDNDTGAEGQLVYNITDGNDGNVFKIDSNGTLMIIGKLNTEVLNKYNLTIKVRDSGIDQKTTTSVIHITISDVNEFMPDCPLPKFVSLPENSSINTSVFLFNCTDRDGDLLTYTVQQPENETFSYSSTKQGLILIKLVDYDSPVQQYMVKIDVSDGIFTTVVNIRIQLTHVNEDQPKFLSNVTLNITENTQPTNPILKYTANDTDYSPDNIVKYFLISDVNISPLFSIDPIAGEISLLKDLDYDSLPVNHKFYILQVVAEDGGGLQANGNGPYVLIPSLGCTDVEDGTNLNYTLSQSPGSHFTIQNQAIQLINIVNATDPDGNDPVFGDPQYTIISGDSTNRFTIGLVSGELALKRMLDYEMEKAYTLVIQAKEIGGFYSSTTNVTILVDDVNDEPPFCDPNFIFSSVAENETANYLIATLNCSDKDAGTNLTYTVDDVNSTKLFQMTGVNLSLKSALDFETATSHVFRINVSDGNHTVQIDVFINVRSIDEYPPVFQNDHYLVNVSEDVNISTVVLTVHANDSDSPLDGNGIVKYMLLASPEFIIDPETGEIIVTKYLDREKTPHYKLTVFAHDASYVANATVEVSVTDINDNPPVFTSSTYSQKISETSPANTSIITVTATDKDDPLTNGNGIVQYAIDRLGRPGALSATAVVSILVTTVNQHQPVFTSNMYNITVKENQYSFGDVILSVTASDNDTGTDGEFTFSLVPPQTKFSLTKNGSLGEIRLIESLDFDKLDQLFQFYIVVTDKGVPSRSCTTTVNIIVDDENDNPPVCTSVFYVAKSEGNNDTNIVNLHCSDADKSNNPSYIVASVSPNKTSFQVSTLGLVKVSGILDYEISSFYEIHILVQDDRQPVHNTTVIINLKVIDINDNDPSFTGPFTFSVNESDVVSSKVLYQANASGNDGPTDVVTYSLLDRTYFDISPTTGEISIKTTAPDYEIFRDNYNLTVCATDTPNPVSRTICQKITATLIDVDDNVPVFSPSIYSASVKEDVPQGVVVSTVTARDADITPAYHTVYYTIIDGNSEKKFSIDNNGSVTINATLDYETTTNYSLVIQASDSLHSANTSLNVLVIPVNEYSPVFSVTNLTLSLPENSPFDTNFTLNISATDRDHGLDGKIFYRIEPGPFSIDPATGVMRVISNLDRETKQTYVLLVQAIDNGIPSKTGTLTLTVEVTDENDSIPECTSVVYTALVSEGTKPQSQLITKLMCHDDDKDPANLNNKITYSIVSGETTKFELNQSGELMLKSNVTLDFESDQKYQIVVKVMDSGLSVQLSSSVTIDVMVKDENDNPPVFIALPNVIIPEDVTVGSKLATVKATDRDSGDNGVVLFTITKGNNDTHFTIDPWNGDIYLTSQLDFETQRIFELEITARDLGFIPLSATGTMTVNVTDINDNVPNCNMIVNAPSLFENSKNVDIASLNCTDKDTVGSLAYSIASVSGINSTFFIINQTGVISVIPAAQIDYETTQQFTLQIQISDGVHSVFSFVKITVLDIDEFDPLFFPPGPYSVNIAEDVSLNTALITIHATDEDKFDNFKYFSIVNGNTDNKFLMDPVTGSVRVLNSLDYETTKFYSLTLQVTDSGNRSTTTVLNITVVDVNDNHPFCNSTWEVIAVNENDFNKTLFIPDCSDLDSNLDINSRYTLVSGNLSSLYFNRTTGVVYLISPLDYEVMTSHTVVIKAFDNGLPDVGVDITLTIIVKPVNEYSPEFSPSNVYNVSVSEDAPVVTAVIYRNIALLDKNSKPNLSGSLVFKVNATDQDKGYLQGTVRYSITGGDPHQYFEIDESSGEIKTVTPLDRETFDSYSITVEAADDFPGSAASKKSTATCIVKINDVNDNTPIFNASLYAANLLETDNSHAILTVFATDKDDPFTKDYGKVTYNIVNGGSDFTIDSITGEINNSHVIDADATGKTFYIISVVATDSGGLAGALKSTTLVAIRLITVNEFKPEFSLPSYSVSINETQFKFGDEILNFSAKDNDTGQDGEFTLEFALPQTKFALVQDGKKGKIILNEALDFENNDTLFHFQVLAKDKGNPSLIGTADITIIVNDDNDNSPTCISVINVDIPENTARIANLTCNDRDTMTAFSYIVGSIIPPSINVSVSSNGIVTASPVLDYEKETSYEIVIQVFDASFSNLKHTASVVINLRVRDLNDNPPFIAGPYNFTISEDEAISSKVLYRLNASGNDGPTDYLTYSLYPSTYFALTPLSGEITLKSAAPDYEIIGPQYIFTVCVTDTPNPISFTVCQNITASIIDVNDVSPVFSPAVYSVSIPESAIVGTNLSVAVTANDGDISPNFKTVTYTIIDGNVAGKFKIDGKNGVISLAQQLDYEIVTSYALIVQVTDSKFTTNASYFIQISPVNEFPPTFNISVINYNITENTLTNVTFSLPFKVTDGDSGLDGQFIYSIDEGPFEIDPSTGLLSVISNIDREKNQFYALLIKAIDKGSEPKTGTLTLSVNVLDENDNAPTCSQYFYTAMFAEEVQIPMIVAALNCLDLDKDPLQKNNAIFYTLVSNNTSLFEVTSNGVIQVKSSVMFDRETQDFYEIIVEVSDQALIERLTTTVVAEITITDLNDNSPIFTNQSSKNLSEDLLPGSFVIKVQANDKDIGKNAELTYSIVGGNTENKFRIDTVTGTINLESYLDYETTKLYKLVITATDRGSPSLTGSMTLTVTVADVNDNPPFCPSFFSSTLVNENTQNLSLGSMSCSDKDTVGSLTYSIISGNVENNFGIDTKGYVFVQPNAQLDFEVKQNYLLQIFVTDGVHNVTELMKVSLIDVNEFKPRFFPSGPYNTTVKENANVGSTVFLLNATDDDIYDNTRSYSIIDASMHLKFIIDSNYIKILSPLDYELEKSYTFSLMVQDSTALNDTTTITVYVEDVNDNNPSCNESLAIVSVDENVSNKVLYVPQCTDADKVASPSLVFSILPGSIPALSVNNTTGVLSLQSGLDYEQNTTIRVVMKVVDNGSPALSAIDKHLGH
ncbi:hypothetical protein Btru_044434 [Bulinus truncatus]|nr:hypothetical protein Btru_044434 [Bulinus truncatus]